MTLSFSQKWPKSMPKHMAGQNTLFPLKVLLSLETEHPQKIIEFKMKTFFNYSRFEGFKHQIWKEIKPKLHTIRLDKNNRWAAGKDIHFVINNRTKNRYQFAPVIPCTDTQEIFLSKPPRGGRIEVSIGDKYLYYSDLTQLAWNDGFNSFEDFEAYFEPQVKETGLSLNLIHWTNLKY